MRNSVAVACMCVACGAFAEGDAARANSGGEAAGETVVLLEPGKENLGWRFDHGGEFPGAKGGLSVEAAAGREGRPALVLAGDFTGGGAYVQAMKDVPALGMESLSFRVKLDVALTALTVRVVDQSICHQIGLRLEPTTDWQQVVLPLRKFFAAGRKDAAVVKYESWGGVNDGAWHGPCKMVCFLIGPTAESKKLTLRLDDVKSIEPVERATTTILPVTMSAERVAPGSFVKIRYAWEPAEPLACDNKAFVHFVDGTGKMVAQDDHSPSVATGSPGWCGAVGYERRVIFAPTLAEGTYDIVAGLYHESSRPPGWRREPLVAGRGVKEVGDRGFKVGRIVIDKNAPRPQADTEKPPTLDLTGFALTFDEGFDGPLEVSAWGPGTRWIAHTPWAGDFGDAAFADPAEGFPFTIANGMLRIEARKDEAFKDKWGRLWRSGLLASNDPSGKGFAQQYGYFEMRAKLPGGPGVWPAFWLASSYDRRNPATGADGAVEIDIIEFYGHHSGAYQSAVHVWTPAPHRAEGGTVTTRPGEVSSDFHRYGVMVARDFVTMYFDGVEVWKTPTPREHNKPLMVLLNLALGSGWPIDKTPSPSYMYVDYVRVYARK